MTPSYETDYLSTNIRRDVTVHPHGLLGLDLLGQTVAKFYECLLLVNIPLGLPGHGLPGHSMKSSL